MSVCILLLATAAAVSAQSFSVGVTAGVPLNPLMAAAGPDYTVSTSRYTVGPTIEVGLPHRLALEADLLYKRLRYEVAGAGAERTSRWELPLLLEYRFAGAVVRPVVGAGASFNRVTGSPNLVELRHRSTKGFVVEAGLETRLGPLRLTPELRFTRWADRNFGVSDARLNSNLSQAEFLVGFTF